MAVSFIRFWPTLFPSVDRRRGEADLYLARHSRGPVTPVCVCVLLSAAQPAWAAEAL